MPRAAFDLHDLFIAGAPGDELPYQKKIGGRDETAATKSTTGCSHPDIRRRCRTNPSRNSCSFISESDKGSSRYGRSSEGESSRRSRNNIKQQSRVEEVGA